MRTYDPTEVSVIFNGVQITGFASDTFVEASRSEDGWTYQPSNSPGGGSRSRNPNKSGVVVITIKDDSPSMALLTAIANADELRGEGVGELMVKDRATATGKVKAQNAWIQKIPDWKRAKEVGTTAWSIFADELFIDHDGVIDDND
jgi:hypothetical protein